MAAISAPPAPLSSTQQTTSLPAPDISTAARFKIDRSLPVSGERRDEEGEDWVFVSAPPDADPGVTFLYISQREDLPTITVEDTSKS